jgi:hypothetical protein
MAALVVSLLVVFYVALGGLLGRTVSEGAYQQLAVLSEVLTRIQNDYVEDPNIDRVTVGAMRGLLEALDPYSSYMSPREFADYQKKKARELQGDVGLVLSKRYGLLNVVNVLPESPAAGANLNTGDIIESIGGFSSREMSVDQGYVLLAGEVGTMVEMAVVRQARSEPQTVELVRRRLRLPRVVSGTLEGQTGYLKIASFSQGKAEEAAAALRRLEAQGMDKLVLDLRDCASGEMQEGVAVTQLLLDAGTITYLDGADQHRHGRPGGSGGGCRAGEQARRSGGAAKLRRGLAATAHPARTRGSADSVGGQVLQPDRQSHPGPGSDAQRAGPATGKRRAGSRACHTAARRPGSAESVGDSARTARRDASQAGRVAIAGYCPRRPWTPEAISTHHTS